MRAGCPWKVLLIGVNKYRGIGKRLLAQKVIQFLLGCAEALAIAGVDHKDECVRIIRVVMPHLSDALLAADVPHGEGDILVLNFFDVEADGRDGDDLLTEFELVDYGCLAGGVQSEEEYLSLLIHTEQCGPNFVCDVTHLCLLLV